MGKVPSTVEKTSLSYALLVLASPYGNESSLLAYRFARAVVKQGHSLKAIFFYHDGVYNASIQQYPPQDEPSPEDLWCSLAEEERVPLQTCIAASLKRGLVDESEAQRHGGTLATLSQGFELAGLGQWIQASGQADRVMTFG